MDIDAMREHIKADSLAFLTIDGLYRAVGEAEGRNKQCPKHCDACFTGEYPTFLTDQSEKEDDKDQLNRIASTGS